MSAPCPILGFVVVLALHADASSSQSDIMVDELIETLESNGLMMGGGGDRVQEYVINREGGQATDADRDLVAGWAARWANVATITVSELVDLNHAA